MVRRGRTGPIWLSRVVIEAVHTDQLREHGGLPGVRDESALESALARPQLRWRHANDTDLARLAAAGAFGIVRNHPFHDGNKRTGFLAMVTFLGVNGADFSASEAEVVTEILALADGRIPEEELADWIRSHIGGVTE